GLQPFDGETALTRVISTARGGNGTCNLLGGSLYRMSALGRWRSHRSLGDPYGRFDEQGNASGLIPACGDVDSSAPSSAPSAAPISHWTSVRFCDGCPGRQRQHESGSASFGISSSTRSSAPRDSSQRRTRTGLSSKPERTWARSPPTPCACGKSCSIY